MRNALIGVAKSSSRKGRIGREMMNSYAPRRNTRVMIVKSSQVKSCQVKSSFV